MLVERNERLYYYESIRNGKRVRRTYITSGDMAAALHNDRIDLADQRAELGRARRAWRMEIAADEAARSGAFAAIGLAVAGALAAMGFHRQNRGPLRRKRGTTMAELATRAAGELARAEAESRSYLATLGEKIRAKNTASTPEIEAKVLADMAEDRARLEGENPTAIERILAERAALCLVECRTLDLIGTNRDAKGLDDAAEKVDRRRTSAHRRLMSSLRTLAQVRKLKLPTILAMQVNMPGTASRRKIGASP